MLKGDTGNLAKYASSAEQITRDGAKPKAKKWSAPAKLASASSTPAPRESAAAVAAAASQARRVSQAPLDAVSLCCAMSEWLSGTRQGRDVRDGGRALPLAVFHDSVRAESVAARGDRLPDEAKRTPKAFALAVSSEPRPREYTKR